MVVVIAAAILLLVVLLLFLQLLLVLFSILHLSISLLLLLLLLLFSVITTETVMAASSWLPSFQYLSCLFLQLILIMSNTDRQKCCLHVCQTKKRQYLFSLFSVYVLYISTSLSEVTFISHRHNVWSLGV